MVLEAEPEEAMAMAAEPQAEEEELREVEVLLVAAAVGKEVLEARVARVEE